MKPYQPLFEEYLTEQLYNEFCHYCVQSNYGEYFLEFRLSRELGAIISKIKEIALSLRVNLKDLLKFFMNRFVFKFFKFLSWSFERLFDLLQQGYKIYKKITGIIPNLVRELGLKASESRAFQWTKDKIEIFDNFIKRHPILKRLTGIALGALVLYIWMNMTFVGEFEFDFDWNTIFDALAGRLGISEIFFTADGIQLLILLGTGLLGASFPWPGSNLIKFAAAIIMTIGKRIKAKFSPDTAKRIEQEYQTVVEGTLQRYKLLFNHERSN